MDFAKELLHRITDQALSESERALSRCRLAKQREDAGNFEGAREAMGELWSRVGERPAFEGLDQFAKASVLLRAGTLTGYIGSTKQIENTQEVAKNLLSESLALFENLQEAERVAEAQIEVAVCYWREGAFDEARVMLQSALSRLGDEEGDLRAVALLRSATVEGSAKRFHDGLRVYNEAAPLVEKSLDLILKAKFHHFFGTLLKKLGASEDRPDYIDRALIEYAAASFYFEQAGLTRYQGCVENNLGFLFGTIGKFVEAHEHLDRAQALFTSLRDSVHLAQVDETRARVMLAAGRAAEAEKLCKAAVRTLEKGGEQSLLAEALTTQGLAQARLQENEKARSTLERAINVAEQAGDLESAGQAALTLIEQLGHHLSNEDVCSVLTRASMLLEKTQDMNTLRRLTTCAFRGFFLVQAFPQPPDWNGFYFRNAVRCFEAGLIKRALVESGGSVTRAAYLLGFEHHQTLVSLLNSRHKNLLHARRPVVPRKRSVTSEQDTSRGSEQSEKKNARAIRILHVEDNEAVANTVKDVLKLEGWQVETCADGTMASEKIAGDSRYDLLLLDCDLPGVGGLELLRQARRLAHRRQIPVVILSGSIDEATARKAGANGFLRKPEDVMAVTETVTRLLRGGKKPNAL